MKIISLTVAIVGCLSVQVFAANKAETDLKLLKQGTYKLKVESSKDVNSCLKVYGDTSSIKLKGSAVYVGSTPIGLNTNNGMVPDDAEESYENHAASDCHYETTTSTQPNKINIEEKFFCSKKLMFSNVTLIQVLSNAQVRIDLVSHHHVGGEKHISCDYWSEPAIK